MGRELSRGRRDENKTRRKKAEKDIKVRKEVTENKWKKKKEGT